MDRGLSACCRTFNV